MNDNGFMGGLSPEQAEAIMQVHKENKEILDAMEPTILIRYHNPDARGPGGVRQAHIGEWFDLRAAHDYNLSPGEFAYVNLGVSIAVPYGYEAILAPRSSTFKKYGIIQTNGIGVIDETYAGDTDIWQMPVFCLRECHIKAGDRIAQFRIQRNQGHPMVKEVSRMNRESRGGLGSTGTN